MRKVREVKRFLKKVNKDNYSELDMCFAPEALEILSKWQYLQPLDMEFYKQFSPVAWALACGNRGVYQIITKELVSFIDYLVKGSRVIEVCAGTGTLGHALNIPTTDRKLIDKPEVQAYYDLHESFFQKKIVYPDYVEKLSAHEAIVKYDPEWILASWVTQKYDSKSKIGQIYGPIEKEFIDGRNYIHCGSGINHVHKKKKLNKYPHWVIEAEWLVARDSHKSQSQMRIWSQNMDIDFDSFPQNLEFDYYLNN